VAAQLVDRCCLIADTAADLPQPVVADSCYTQPPKFGEDFIDPLRLVDLSHTNAQRNRPAQCLDDVRTGPGIAAGPPGDGGVLEGIVTVVTAR
jgi:hypothetical protein